MKPASGISSLFDRFRALVRELRAANGANVTITFAIATIPVIGLVGAAVDYSHGNSVKAAMQAAVDSTALMLSKQASGLNQSDIQAKADAYFKALFNRPEATGVTVTATYTSSGGSKVVVAANANVKTNFMGLMGVTQLNIGADSMAMWGNSRLRVALALDTTGSMASDGKIDALKTATKALLDQLKTAASKDGDVYVSIIPFSKDINVGKANYQASWIDWSDWDETNGTCSKKDWTVSSRSECLSQNGSPTWTPDNHNTWNGCVTDRGNSDAPATGNYDTNVTAPTATNMPTLFAAEQYGSCSPKVMPLSYDWTSMKSLVDSFYPSGNTNQGIGLAHAWMSLVGGGPYPTPPAEEAGYKYQKIIILMSDGLNTQNRWYSGGGWSNNGVDKIDARQKMTCDNVKAAGITLYTIHVNTDGDPKSTLLQGCASSADKFWMLTRASELVATFKQIGTNLSNLRLAE
ncbi:MAG: pilus assembly protein [Xanthobacteraceae bacterium]|nr:pilus assembly protein [Xanthobacteraceae bacterium]